MIRKVEHYRRSSISTCVNIWLIQTDLALILQNYEVDEIDYINKKKLKFYIENIN